MPLILLGCVGAIWGISYPITAAALQGFDVLTLRVLVQTLGAVAMLVQAILLRRSLQIEREAWPDLVIAALLNMTVLPVAFSIGIWLLGPGRTSVLVYTMPIWAALFARLLLGERLTAMRLAALGFGVGAVAALMSQNLPELRNAPLGAAVTVLAAMSYGLGTVWLKRRRWRANAAAVVFWQLLIGTLPIAVGWLMLRFPPDLARVGEREWLAALFLGVAGNGIAYFAWFRAVGLLPAAVVGTGTLITPAIAVFSSVWLAGETLHPHDVAAILMIAAALTLVIVERVGGMLRLAPHRGRRRGGATVD
jgi:drug/metabolite transporter (DMT)-like permease